LALPTLGRGFKSPDKAALPKPNIVTSTHHCKQEKTTCRLFVVLHCAEIVLFIRGVGGMEEISFLNIDGPSILQKREN
jgi:hypothetical protein